METITKQVSLKMEDKGHYVSIPFAVGKNVESVSVKFTYEKDFPRDVLGAALYSPNGPRGCFTLDKDSCTVSAEFATPGFLAGSIEEGEWAVSIDVAFISKEALPVEIVITLEESKPRWIKTDLHLHTNHSDGGYTMEETAKLAIDAGLDMIALTDHNSTTQNTFPKTVGGLVRVPGYEWTNLMGHCNFLGLAHPVKDFRAETPAQAKTVITEAVENGATVVLNHPGDPLGGWEAGYDVPFHALEIWNGPWRNTNDNSLVLWQDMLCAGRKVPVVGGSDTHRLFAVTHHGYPCTHVYIEKLEAAAILEAVRSGKVYVTATPQGPKLDFTLNDADMGQTAQARAENELCFHITGLQPGDELRLINSDGLFKRIIAATPAEKRHIKVPTNMFYRLEIWRRNILEAKPLLISNPVYLETK